LTFSGETQEKFGGMVFENIELTGLSRKTEMAMGGIDG
jgi:hypothetical protein